MTLDPQQMCMRLAGRNYTGYVIRVFVPAILRIMAETMEKLEWAVPSVQFHGGMNIHLQGSVSVARHFPPK